LTKPTKAKATPMASNTMPSTDINFDMGSPPLRADSTAYV
jgi:hypothetical protein